MLARASSPVALEVALPVLNGELVELLPCDPSRVAAPMPLYSSTTAVQSAAFAQLRDADCVPLPQLGRNSQPVRTRLDADSTCCGPVVHPDALVVPASVFVLRQRAKRTTRRFPAVQPVLLTLSEVPPVPEPLPSVATDPEPTKPAIDYRPTRARCTARSHWPAGQRWDFPSVAWSPPATSRAR